MEPILSFDKLTKKYKDFTLDHISFQIPRGHDRRNDRRKWGGKDHHTDVCI